VVERAEGQMKRAESNNLLSIPSGVEVSEIGLKITGRLSYDQWADMMKGIQRAHRSMLWVLGDGFVYGEAKFGEAFSQAIEEYSRESARNAMWVSSQIPPVRRLTALSWSHHQQVASLPADEQGKFLKSAVEKRLTVHELRAAVRLFRTPAPKLDWHETGDGPEVVPDPEPEFEEVAEVRHSYAETTEQVRADFTPAPPVDPEKEFRHLFSLVKALRIAERGDDDKTALRLRTSLDFFIARHERCEERGE